MILEKGNMWDCFGKVDLFLVTTNPIVNAKGELVMGRGIALEAKKRFPELPKDFARMTKEYRDEQNYADLLHPVNVGVAGRYSITYDKDGNEVSRTENQWNVRIVHD